MRGNIKMKIVCILLIGVFCVFTNCCAQEQNILHSNDGHFSLILPENWISYSQDELKAENVQLKEIAGENAFFVHVFYKQVNSKLIAEIHVQIDKDGRVPESDIQQNLLSPIGQSVLAEGVEKSSDKGSVKSGKIQYDKEKDIVYTEMLVDNNGQKEMRISALVLSQYGYVTLSLSSLIKDVHSNLNDFFQIMDSFKFDEGYGYKAQ